MSNYFSSLTQQEINNNITTTYIQDVQQDLQQQLINLDFETQVNPNLNQWVSDGNTTTYGNGNDLVSVGTNNTILQDSSQVINLGSQNTNENSVNSVIIGHNTTIKSENPINLNNYNTIIGNNSNLELANGGILYNTVIASNCTVTGNRNIVLGNFSPNNTGNISNTVQLLQEPLNTNFGITPAVTGSVIISSSSSGGSPSALPRVQFLSEHLTRLQGTNASTQFNPSVTFSTPSNINGYMRIKYQKYALLIPVIVDPNDNLEAPIYP